ncbi:hypothetical protein AArcSl_2389 [Halalkaliarchaeum desulfuricum]|uniref:DUF8120 domain-containing protein n=1 Tax=Halalkaliarchaeum desulfuricum TaxID=2055893 RepID=A0A343TLN9_9EURY|nr:hypothetical protein [Halalkaliarchaeum desulfuricum]AUX10011.1 hypothetical protein AArcSl_2389 [Halalkaliarchaeum desulfuricum]
MRERLPVLDRRTYRWTDRVTKLGGVLAVAVALEIGIVSGGGIALALAGGVLALSTVPIETRPAADAGPTDAYDGEPT